MTESALPELVMTESGFRIRRYAGPDGKIHYDWPVPPGLEMTDRLALSVRLWYSRSGKAAWWESADTETVRASLSRALYNPVLRAVVTSFVWWPPCQRDRDRLCKNAKYLENFVLQGGGGALNWRASVVGPLPDPVRDALQQWARCTRADGWKPEAVQGNLRVYRWGFANPKDPCHPKNGMSRILEFWPLFNHTVCGWTAIAGPRVFDVDGVPTAIALVTPTQGDVVVLSPDHPFEPVRLQHEHLHILAHPLPTWAGD